jgi:hypothetical protein
VPFLGEALAAVALLYQFFCVPERSRPVKTVPESFGHYGSGGGVVAALSLMDFP